jgi:hypothetical protein
VSARAGRLRSHLEIVQGLPSALCSFHSYCCHLDCLSASGLDINRALRPPELLVGEDDSESHEGQTKEADDQGGDPVLALDRRHGDGVEAVVQGCEMTRGTWVVRELDI